MSTMVAWDVRLDGRILDTVFFGESCEKSYVYNSLVDHDGYHPSIEIRKVG